MKLKDGFILQEVAGRCIGLACGEAAVNFNGMILSNPVGEFALRLLQKQDMTEDQLVDSIYSEYEAPRETIRKDIREWLDELRKYQLLDE